MAEDVREVGMIMGGAGQGKGSRRVPCAHHVALGNEGHDVRGSTSWHAADKCHPHSEALLQAPVAAYEVPVQRSDWVQGVRGSGGAGDHRTAGSGRGTAVQRSDWNKVGEMMQLRHKGCRHTNVQQCRARLGIKQSHAYPVLQLRGHGMFEEPSPDAREE